MRTLLHHSQKVTGRVVEGTEFREQRYRVAAVPFREIAGLCGQKLAGSASHLCHRYSYAGPAADSSSQSRSSCDSIRNGTGAIQRHRGEGDSCETMFWEQWLLLVC